MGRLNREHAAAGHRVIGPVLVTGSNGFLGRALASHLMARGETVIAFDLTASSSPSACHDGDGCAARVIPVSGDIRDRDALQAAAETHGARAIVHLAAVNIPTCRAHPVKGAEVMVLGHLNMLDVARRTKIGKVLYTSSIAARPRGPLNSQSNLYGAYKHCCEHISKVYYQDWGIPSIGLRPNVVYGPGREAGETSAITQAMKAAARDEPYTIPFTGEMCFQYIDEVVDIFARCLVAEESGAIISDLTTEPLSISDVIAAIKVARPGACIEAASQYRPAPGELDNSLLRSLLGDWPHISLMEGTRRTIEYYARRQ